MNPYISHITLYKLACMGTTLTCMTFALLLWFAPRRRRPANRLLGLALAVIAAFDVGAMGILFALGPLLFFYARKQVNPERKFHWTDLFHFCLLIGAHFVPHCFIQMSVVVYLYFSWRLVRAYYRQQLPVQMDRPLVAFKQLEIILQILAIICLLWFFNDFFAIAFAAVLICMAALTILRQDEENPVSQMAVITPRLRKKSSWLKSVVKTNRYYLNPELSLTKLAEALGLTPHELSWIINSGLKQSFNDFINAYRVKEVIRNMQDSSHDHLTLLGIAYDSGFNSQTTFTRAFKQITGKTPIEYKMALKKEYPSYNLNSRQLLTDVVSDQSNRNFMIRNYLKIAWRNLTRTKAQSAVNIIGLSVGMAVAMLIGLWIYDELAYNRSYAHYDRIAEVMVHVNYDGQISTISSNPLPMVAVLSNEYGRDFKTVVVSTGTQRHRMIFGDKKLDASGRFMSPAVTELLSLHMVSGSNSGLQQPGGILLSATLAQKLFNSRNPIGKLVSIDNKQPVNVTGVYEDQPDNSEFKDLGFIAPFDLFLAGNPWAQQAQDNWGSQFVTIYVQLNNHAEFSLVSAKIKDSKLSLVSGAQAARKPIVFLQPMSCWHLYSKFENGVNVRSDELKYVWFYGTIGLFVLSLACINFMNLSTARSEKRAKEVGIRKVIGSARIQLVIQFYLESLLMVCIGYLLSIGLVWLSLPWFNGVAGKTIQIPWINGLFWLAGIVFILVTGLLAGSYPALYLSSFRPIKVLKGSIRAGRYATLPRQVLVVLQFSVSIALIIGTIFVYQQVQFAQQRPVGYSQNSLVTVPLSGDMQAKHAILNNELKTTGAISGIAESSSPLTSIWSTSTDIDWSRKAPSVKKEFSTISVSSDYGRTIGWQFVSGRDFSATTASDSGSFVINESAVKEMGLKDPLNALIKYQGSNYRVIGVVKDMIMESPFKPALATVFFLKGDRNCMFIRLNPAQSAQVSLMKVMGIFKKVLPDGAIDYTFVDEDFAAKFAAEVRIGNLAGCFSALAIIISCLGLFGMASFMAEQRVKELGVRKLLGATVFNLWYTQSISFIKLVLYSLVIAIPLSAWFMHSWLQGYAYRISLSWWVFAGAGFGAMIITVLTVSYQSLKAALTNPVKSLRSE